MSSLQGCQKVNYADTKLFIEQYIEAWKEDVVKEQGHTVFNDFPDIDKGSIYALTLFQKSFENWFDKKVQG